MKLPLNATVDYFDGFLTREEADVLYRALIDEYRLDQERHVVMAGGELIETDTFKILFMTEEMKAANTHPEEIHGKHYVWTGAMAALREKVGAFVGKPFDLAMCLFYPDGNFEAPYHFDQQTSGANTILPSISLGEVRHFCFRENASGEVYCLDLANGSLLLMGEHCQGRYEHSLPKDPGYKNGRINITFRDANFK